MANWVATRQDARSGLGDLPLVIASHVLESAMRTASSSILLDGTHRPPRSIRLAQEALEWADSISKLVKSRARGPQPANHCDMCTPAIPDDRKEAPRRFSARGSTHLAPRAQQTGGHLTQISKLSFLPRSARTNEEHQPRQDPGAALGSSATVRRTASTPHDSASPAILQDPPSVEHLRAALIAQAPIFRSARRALRAGRHAAERVPHPSARCSLYKSRYPLPRCANALLANCRLGRRLSLSTDTRRRRGCRTRRRCLNHLEEDLGCSFNDTRASSVRSPL